MKLEFKVEFRIGFWVLRLGFRVMVRFNGMVKYNEFIVWFRIRFKIRLIGLLGIRFGVYESQELSVHQKCTNNTSNWICNLKKMIFFTEYTLICTYIRP